MGGTRQRRWLGRMLMVTVGVILAGAVLTLFWVLPATTTSSVPGETRARRSPTTPSPTPSPQPVIADLEVVGLGDSVMAGSHCECDGIPAEFAKELTSRTSTAAHATNLGQGGYTTADVMDDLSNDAATRRQVATADVVLLIVGANDLGGPLDSWQNGGCDATCYRPTVEAMGKRLSGILDQIAQLEGSHPYTLLVDGYWNVFTDGSTAIKQGGNEQVTWSRALTREVNSVIRTDAEQVGGRYVDLTDTFADDPDLLLADDGDHPNAAGVKAIAKANLQVLLHR